MLVDAWRKRNQKWAAQHLTPAKSQLFQRRWNSISRFRLLPFSLFAGLALALWFEFCFLAISFVTGNIQQVARSFGRGFVLSEYVAHNLPVAILVGVIVAATYYCAMREYAKLQPGKLA